MSLASPPHSRRRPLLLGIVAVAIGAVLSGCASAAPTADPAPTPDVAETRSIEHTLGETEITGEPQTVVALEFSFVQALDELDVVPAGIADDDDPARVEQLLGKTIEYSSVGTRLEPNLELVSSLNPDLIIADETRHAAIYDQLRQIAPTIVLNSWEGTYQEIKDAVVTIGDALGDKQAGIDAVAAHEERLAEIASRIPAGEDRTFMLAVATPDAMTLHTSSAFTGDLFNALGLTPAIQSEEPLESGVGIERLLAVNPDVLFVATDGPGTVFEQWQQNNAWAGMSAAQAGDVYEVDRNQFARFRGLQTAEILAEDVVPKITGGN